MYKIDPHTLEEFLPSRKNQKFANEQNKIDYHNELARKEREMRKEVDSKIIKNYRILKTLLGDENQIEIKKTELYRAGYDYRFFNHVKQEVINDVKCQFYGVYQFMFAFTDDQQNDLLIIKIKEDELH